MMTPTKVKLKVYIKIYNDKVNTMKPPQNTVQGKPAYSMSAGKYRPNLTDGASDRPFQTNLASKVLPNKKVKDEYIPTLMKQMGIETNQYELSLGCRSVNDLRKVVRGNGVFYNRQLLNAAPIRTLSRQAFTSDRVGDFGFNARQSVQVAPSTW